MVLLLPESKTIINGNRTFFTSDTHFGHKNIIKYCNRPFNSVEEMDEKLIENWNSVVGPKDWVFHLGDFCFKFDKEGKNYSYYKKRLNGEIFLIIGNHDNYYIEKNKGNVTCFNFVKDVHNYKYKYHDYNGKIQTNHLFLSHYSHRIWPASHKGTGHLYGHSHGNIPSYGLSFDVGVDCWDYKPISLTQVVSKLDELQLNLNKEKQKENIIKRTFYYIFKKRKNN